MIGIFLTRIGTIILVVQLLTACTAFHSPNANLPNRGNIVAGETITVKGNENIYTIARAHNVSMREMIVLNDLQPPFALKPGQSLILPDDTSGGNAMHGMAPPPQPAPSGVIEQAPLPPLPNTPHVDSLAPTGNGGGSVATNASAGSIASQPVTTTAVDALNRPTPAPTHTLATTASPNSSAPSIGGKSTDIGMVAGAGAIAATPETKPPVPPQIQPAAAQPFTAIWPVQGPILSNYGPKGQGLNNDGINIGAPKGSPVVAAAGGMVVYSGNEMKGFGNLILIRHEGGWVTAYSHLERMLVSKDTVVAQGDMIGTVGKSGNVPSPQLHFEVRQAGKPVDPNTVIKG
jgi:murein DD-endopeptidase MepM/ murein hydrolase activator NlpD